MTATRQQRSSVAAGRLFTPFVTNSKKRSGISTEIPTSEGGNARGRPAASGCYCQRLPGFNLASRSMPRLDARCCRSQRSSSILLVAKLLPCHSTSSFLLCQCSLFGDVSNRRRLRLADRDYARPAMSKSCAEAIRRYRGHAPIRSNGFGPYTCERQVTWLCGGRGMSLWLAENNRAASAIVRFLVD